MNNLSRITTDRKQSSSTGYVDLKYTGIIIGEKNGWVEIDLCERKYTIKKGALFSSEVPDGYEFTGDRVRIPQRIITEILELRDEKI